MLMRAAPKAHARGQPQATSTVMGAAFTVPRRPSVPKRRSAMSNSF